MIKLKEDPRPDCEHDWWGLGATTICDPAIHHSACFKCRTFRHRTSYIDMAAKCIHEEVWYSTEWTSGPWDWEAEAKRAGKVLGPADAPAPTKLQEFDAVKFEADMRQLIDTFVRRTIREELPRLLVELDLAIATEQMVQMDKVLEGITPQEEAERIARDASLVIHDRTACGTPREIVVPPTIKDPQ